MPDDIDAGTPATEPQGTGTEPASTATEPAGTEPTPQPSTDGAPATMAEAVEKSVGGTSVLDDAGANDATPAAPERYEAFTDESGREYDAETLGDFVATAKELGLSQEGAQKMFKAMRPSMQGVFVREITERNKEWIAAAETDKEYGGENFKANMAYAKKAYDRYASAELKQVFSKTGLGNNPEIIRLFYRVGKAISQDPGVGGRAPEPRSTVSARYPNTPGMMDD